MSLAKYDREQGPFLSLMETSSERCITYANYLSEQAMNIEFATARLTEQPPFDTKALAAMVRAQRVMMEAAARIGASINRFQSLPIDLPSYMEAAE